MCPFYLVDKKKLSSYIVSDIWYVLHLKPWRETAVHMARLTWNRADKDEELNVLESEYIYRLGHWTVPGQLKMCNDLHTI